MKLHRPALFLCFDDHYAPVRRKFGLTEFHALFGRATGRGIARVTQLSGLKRYAPES